MTTGDLTDLARRIEALTERGRWVSIGSIDSHRSIHLNHSDLDDLRVAAAGLRRLEALVEAIGDPSQLRAIATFGLGRRSHTDGHAYLRRIADAVEGTP